MSGHFWLLCQWFPLPDLGTRGHWTYKSRHLVSGLTSVAGLGLNFGMVGPLVIVSRVRIDGYTATSYRDDSVLSGILEPGRGERKRESTRRDGAEKLGSQGKQVSETGLTGDKGVSCIDKV